VVIAREITVAMYHMLNRREEYRLGTDALKINKKPFFQKVLKALPKKQYTFYTIKKQE